MNNILLANLGQNVSAAILLTWISIFQVLVLEILCSPHLKLSEQDNRVVAHNIVGQWTKYCKKLDIWITQKLTVMLITYILLLPTSALIASILLVATHLISLMVIITQ